MSFNGGATPPILAGSLLTGQFFGFRIGGRIDELNPFTKSSETSLVKGTDTINCLASRHTSNFNLGKLLPNDLYQWVIDASNFHKHYTKMRVRMDFTCYRRQMYISTTFLLKRIAL